MYFHLYHLKLVFFTRKCLFFLSSKECYMKIFFFVNYSSKCINKEFVFQFSRRKYFQRKIIIISVNLRFFNFHPCSSPVNFQNFVVIDRHFESLGFYSDSNALIIHPATHTHARGKFLLFELSSCVENFWLLLCD